MTRPMTPEDRVTYLPTTDEEFDEAAADVFRRVVSSAVELYIERHRRDELPVSLMDFALSIPFDVGQRDAYREMYGNERCK